MLLWKDVYNLLSEKQAAELKICIKILKGSSTHVYVYAVLYAQKFPGTFEVIVVTVYKVELEMVMATETWIFFPLDSTVVFEILSFAHY